MWCCVCACDSRPQGYKVCCISIYLFRLTCTCVWSFSCVAFGRLLLWLLVVLVFGFVVFARSVLHFVSNHFCSRARALFPSGFYYFYCKTPKYIKVILLFPNILILHISFTFWVVRRLSLDLSINFLSPLSFSSALLWFTVRIHVFCTLVVHVGWGLDGRKGAVHL